MIDLSHHLCISYWAYFLSYSLEMLFNLNLAKAYLVLLPEINPDILHRIQWHLEVDVAILLDHQILENPFLLLLLSFKASRTHKFCDCQKKATGPFVLHYYNWVLMQWLLHKWSLILFSYKLMSKLSLLSPNSIRLRNCIGDQDFSSIWDFSTNRN